MGGRHATREWKGNIMMTQVLVSEMVAVAERELMDSVARSSRKNWKAQAGQEIGQQARARKLVSAFLQRAGRPLGRGTAPAGGLQPQPTSTAITLRAAGN
jgi:hypothetical protein